MPRRDGKNVGVQNYHAKATMTFIIKKMKSNTQLLLVILVETCGIVYIHVVHEDCWS